MKNQILTGILNDLKGIPKLFMKADGKLDVKKLLVQFGPYLLAAISDDTDFIHPDISKFAEKTDGERGEFTDGEICYKPLYRIDNEHYHVYFR